MRVFKFSLSILIEKVTLSIGFPCQLLIQVKRGKQRLESSTKDLVAAQAIFNEELSLDTNLYFDQVFLEKKCFFLVQMMVPNNKQSKVAGQVSVDISKYLNAHQESCHEILKLEKCPDKHAKLLFTIKFKMLQEIDIDTLSRISAANNDSFEKDEPTKELPKEPDQKIDENYVTQLLQQIHQLKISKCEAMDKNQLLEEQLLSLKTQLQQNTNQIIQFKTYQTAQSQQILDLQNKLVYIEKYSKDLESELQLAKQSIKQKEKELLDIKQQTQRALLQASDEVQMNKKIEQLQLQLANEKTRHEQEINIYYVKEKNLQNQLIDKSDQIAQLKKQTDLPKKMNESQQIIMMTQQINELKSSVQKQTSKEEQFNQILNQYKDQLQKQILQEKQSRKSIDLLQEQVITLKCQVGQIFNAAQDIGGSKLVDQLQSAFGLQ